MRDIGVELAEVELPHFGTPSIEPHVGSAEYEDRLRHLWRRAAARGLDFVLVYGDREHFANLAYLTGFDPRFEEALLILRDGALPTLLVGNECWAYSSISPLTLERKLYQPFSLMGQDRSRSAPLSDILREAGLANGTRVGIVDWKYFGAEVGPDPDHWINAPAYLVQTVDDITGRLPVNVTDILMNPRDGLRTVSSVDQLACFEFAASHLSSAMRRALLGLRPGLSGLDAFAETKMTGLPLSLHPVMAAGPDASLGLSSPSSRPLELGDPMLLGVGIWGALCARAGFLVHDETELPVAIRDYVGRVVEPYFSAIVEWYEHVGVGIKGGELFGIIARRLGDPSSE